MNKSFKKLLIYSILLTLLCIVFLSLVFVKYANFDSFDLRSNKPITSPGKYVYFATNLGGFNNQLEQLWMYKLIAKLSGRDLVINGFHPQRDEFKLTPISTYIDESSFLDGLRGISAEEFNSTCGPNTQVIAKGRWGTWDPKVDQIRELVGEIKSAKDNCLMITGHSPSYLYYWSDYFLRDYPDIREKSLANFKLTKKVLDTANKFKAEHGLNNEKYLAIHLRRGDFEEHCKTRLQPRNSTAFSFSQLFGKFPALLPEDSYMDHCFPPIPKIIKVIDATMAKYPIKPSTIFLMHNANKTELEELSPLLKQRFDKVLQFKHTGSNGWDGTHSLLTEMTVGSESDYFIGNLHSTVTSNLLAIREVKNFPREFVYFL